MYSSFLDDGVPLSVDFVRCDPTQMVATYTSCNTYIFDIETGKRIITLETKLHAGKIVQNQKSYYVLSEWSSGYNAGL